MPMPMTGRTNELNALENEYMKESSMVVVTGRRGMGKTRLVSEFASGKNYLYFLATPVNEHVLLSELNAAVNRFCGLNEPASSWIGVLGRFASHYDNKKILIIDGFHNTASFGTKFLEGLRGIWDDILSQRNVTLILVGSLLPYMRSFTEDSDSPLYGAVSASLTLGPLPFRDTVDDMDYRDAVAMYSIHGGVPALMERLHGMTVEDALGEVLDPASGTFDHPIRTLEGEVKEVSVYLSILRAIAEGRNRITQISVYVGIAPTTLNAYLRKLLDNGALTRSVPSTEYLPERSKSGIYSISDHGTLFWLRFVHPYVSQLSIGDTGAARNALEQGFHAHARETYAEICRDAVQSLAGEIGFLPVLSGRYWNRDTDIDIIAMNPAKRRALVAGCLFLKDRKASRDDLNELLHKAEKAPELKGYVVKLGLFSVTGFEEDILAERNLLLVDGSGTVGREHNLG